MQNVTMFVEVDAVNNEIVIKNIKSWLKKNNHPQSWLAKQIDVSAPLVSQMLNGERKMQTKHLLRISTVTGLTPDDLAKDAHNPADNELKCTLRGSFSNPKLAKNFDKLLWDIQCYVDLEVANHE
ncbi:helix-turn-helix domain-containing protein [Levilactobacillus yiduensis]|uniref:helix-turn-helix domain-containing protein n=1 Tax=Levilactobacillus yiduensis TaxID=2953880 RepID=UPI000EF2A670|nr:helix-turn-helix transcriptional regulator [Levilactobacillus yiduensis]AYM01552.1 XRE family transcriptional regulator [Levilactobacillus brevis]